MKTRTRTLLGASLLLAGVALWPAYEAADRREPTAEQFQQMLRRFPDAILNKDGRLTADEFREYRRKTRSSEVLPSASRSSHGMPPPRAAPTHSPSAGPVKIEITANKPVPVNPRVYGIICEEMFVKDLVDEPEYIAALTDLQFKTFNYPGGSISYYHHPKGTGGFNIRPEEVAKSRHGEQSRFMKEGSGPDHFEQYIRFVKASGGAAVFTANILNGTVAELDEFLSRLQAERIPIAAVVLGVEMHLGQAAALGLDGYVARIKPYITMLQAKHPTVPIVAHSTPVGRVGAGGRDSFHEWNRQLAKLPGISGFSQYGWTEFGGQPRLGRQDSGAAAGTPVEVWQQYDEFVRTFPEQQISTYRKDWGGDKKMHLVQWGTHSDRNSVVQGLHIANFYFFLAQYNAAHNDYFAAATSALILAEKASAGRRRRGDGIIYKEKISLFAPYFYTKPFRHLFRGDKNLLAASVQGVENQATVPSVKALAAAGPDGRKYLYVINGGPAVALGRVVLDSGMLPADLPLQVEAVFETPDRESSVPGSVPIKIFAGEKKLRDVTLEPWSLTLLMTPAPPAPRAPLKPEDRVRYSEVARKIMDENRSVPVTSAPVQAAPAPAANSDKDGARIQWVWPNPKEPAGCKAKTFHAETTKQNVSYLIWLPPGYNPDDAQTRYPVVYFLHGGGGNYENIPAAFLPQATKAIKDRQMSPIIGVVVNGLAGSLYIDSADGTTPVERIIINDLIPHIDTTYRTDPQRRVLEGFSMGGYGATHLAFKYPERFVGVADFAGAVQSWEFFGRMPNINRAWGSEERFLAEWPMTLARQNADGIRKHIRQVFIAVGDRDTGRGNTLDSNTRLHKLLDALKIPNQFTIVPGVKHSYQNLCEDRAVAEKHIRFYADLFGKK